MDHHETDSRTLGRALEILTENGMDGMAKALEIVFNTAMKIERGEFLKAGPFERTDERIGHANDCPLANRAKRSPRFERLAHQVTVEWPSGGRRVGRRAATWHGREQRGDRGREEDSWIAAPGKDQAQRSRLSDLGSARMATG